MQLFCYSWCFFISKWWFFYYRNGLWNLPNWRIFGVLVLGLPVRFNWISKKLKEKSEFRANVYVVNGLHSENNRAVTWQIQYFLRQRGNSCYSVLTLGNHGIDVKKCWCFEVLQSIMTWYMNLLTLSYPLRYAKRLVKYLKGKE